MKKLLMVVILLGLGWSFPIIARADAGFQLEMASLKTAWSETDGAWVTVYQLNAEADWEWLKFGLSGKFDNSAVDGISSNLKLDIDFPKIEDGLGFDIQYSWDDQYRILNTGASYTRDFGEHWQAALKYENEQRDGLTPDSRLYSRQIDQGSITLELEYEPWKYQIKYLGQINDYLENPNKYSTQTAFEQEISWRPGKDLRFIIYYQEKACNFPMDYPSNSWDAKYGLQGDWKAGELWQWSWDYYRLSREKVNRIEERQSFKLELESGFDDKNKLVTQFRSSDGSTDFDEEYQVTVPEDDPGVDWPPAVPTLKVTVKYIHKFGSCSVGVGYSYSEEHDPAKEDTLIRSGIFASWDWEYEKMNLAFKAAPAGDFQHGLAYYEIKISYEF